MPGGDSSSSSSSLTDADLARIIAALRENNVLENDRKTRDDKDGKRYWKTSDVGYFWPDMPLQYGAGGVID
jgi:hypothetical protein